MTELNISENLIKVLMRQRDVAINRCAELEAKYVTVVERLTELENKEQAEDLFTTKE
jgi:hypothetical protein|tara:strand:+ start:2301 stop:2471 length:171 start_codon:yes stop_codon:yes gene_type:complete